MKTLKDINWNQVYYFYEVAKNLSMKETSKDLGVSLPTISDQIKKLEKSIGCLLFTRVPRKLSLTKEGGALFLHAKEIFDSGRRFLDTLSPNPIGGYSVKVGIQKSIMTSLAIEFISLYWDLFAPFGTVHTRGTMMVDDMIQRILCGELDWGISLTPPSSERIAYKKIGEKELLFCCSKRLYKKFKRRKDIIKNIPFAKSAWDIHINKFIEEYLISQQVFPQEIIETDHMELAAMLAKRGRCVSVFDEFTLKNYVLRNSLASFSLGKKLKISYYALWAQGTEKMISIKKLLELLNEGRKPKIHEDEYLQIKVSEVPSDQLEDMPN